MEHCPLKDGDWLVVHHESYPGSEGLELVLVEMRVCSPGKPEEHFSMTLGLPQILLHSKLGVVGSVHSEYKQSVYVYVCVWGGLPRATP